MTFESSAAFRLPELKLYTAKSLLLQGSATDMNTATACKVAGVGVLWGFRDRDELTSAGAEEIVDAPMQILELFE